MYSVTGSRVVSENLVAEMFENFSDSYQTALSITVFTKAHHMSPVLKLCENNSTEQNPS